MLIRKNTSKSILSRFQIPTMYLTCPEQLNSWEKHLVNKDKTT